ncbi:GxGYxYP domain-containing protein [Aquisphaera insulae]|uniref:GxGYxYP domain-containing protein n=1 Tax=Aquisphaera insulae TaxID=2712864 RepID=UPI0013EB0468|nr:GxGYxYP domain-containing protein [Aquisphaera insulae]
MATTMLVAATAVAGEPHWFPVQAPAAGVVRTVLEGEYPEPNRAYAMLVQSVAGLAAQAVNEHRGDELVWVSTTNRDLEDWYARILRRPGAPAARAEALDPWTLVDRFRKAGIVHGYVLYRADASKGEINEHRPGLDNSVNVATSLAGVLGGVLVEEALEPEARRRGLERLADARDRTLSWCFETYRDRFNRRLLVCQDPRKPNVRDLAIAQKCFTAYGPDSSVEAAMKWMEPLSGVIGWNGGDEFETTRLSTVHGQFQTATDWCMNLPVLMAGSSASPSPGVEPFDPSSIDWKDDRGAVSFVMTDGDNVQWYEGGFFGGPSYWSSPARGKIAFGWSCPFAHLAQLGPVLIDRAREQRGPNDSFLEWGGGYYYPDLFARDRPDRWGLLAEHARRTTQLMQRTGTRLIGFNVSDIDSPDAIRSYQAIAGASRGLAAILAFEYNPYEGGAGRVWWVRDADGVEIPVISTRYSIWEHYPAGRSGGTPAKVARLIRESDAAAAAAKEAPRLDWVIVHAWSYFRHAPGSDESAEEMPQDEGPSRGVRGYVPATWCAERLPESIRVIAPEELAWRIRMRHDPAATRKAIQAFRH